MRKNGLLLPILIVAASGIRAGEPAVSTANCSPYAKPPGENERQDAGPYRLTSVQCVNPLKIYDRFMPSVSPDGSHAAWADDYGVTVADLRSGRSSFFDAPTYGLKFGGVSVESPIAWSQDSKSLWATTRKRARGGFPTSGGTIIRLAMDGALLTTPALSSWSGPLDAVQWIPGTTTAIVQFGTHGGTYRPTHADPTPELAMVDTATGRILDRLPLHSLRSFRERAAGFDPRFSLAAATAVVASGRVHAIVTIQTRTGRTWVRWTQGLPPVELPVPTKEPSSRIMLLPSGKQFLRMTELQPSGIQVFHGNFLPGSIGPPRPKPRTGVLLELKSFRTGKSVWSTVHTVKDFWQVDFLEVSPDGRYAVVSWPDRRGMNAQAALIDLRNGTVAQIFPLGVSGGQAGFTENGSAIWIRVANEFRMYRQH